MKTDNQRKAYSRGIALISVLAVLTVLAICAASFVIFTHLEHISSQATVAKVQADILASSGLEHALSELRNDADEQPAWDDPGEDWNTIFKPRAGDGDAGTDVDGLPDSEMDARWVYVRNDDGRIIGRYAVMVEDESGKININAATALNTGMQNEGVGTFEIMLTDGRNAGLPVSLEFGKNLLRYRYGGDFRPGQANEDDNYTVSTYLADEIDNDADGLVDEEKEGIDEPDEYMAAKLAWDDRSFMSIREAVRQCAPKRTLSQQHSRLLSRYATVHTSSLETYWDDRERGWEKQVNLNIGSKNQIGKLMRRANEEAQFETKSANMRNLICNVIDYRDENHVLSTYSSEYGVEAVCFNEVMANEGSYSVEPEWNNPQSADEHKHVHRFGWWYYTSSIPGLKGNALYSWQITSVSPAGGGTSLQNGKSASSSQGAYVKLSDDMRKPLTVNGAYDRFKKVLKQNGGWPPELWKNGWLVVSSTHTIASDPDNGIRYPIIGNTKDTLHVGCNPNGKNTYELLAAIAGQSSLSNAVWIDNLWRYGNTIKCMFPQVSEYFILPVHTFADIKPPENLYYYVYTSEQAFLGNMGWGYDYPLQGKTIPWKGYNRYLDVDGDPSHKSKQEIEYLTRDMLKGSTLEFPADEDKFDLMRFAYKGGEPVRARDNMIHVILTTPDDCGYAGGIGTGSDKQANENKTSVTTLYMMRPDVVELINISDRPISLRNWRVVVNTGSYADRLGMIESGVRYSSKLQRRYEDPNPVIPPGGYFYLTNKRAIFDYEYGSQKDGVWGNTPEEQAPVYEMFDALWGVRYEVTKVSIWTLHVKGANWRPDQMRYEIGEIFTTRKSNKRNSPTGVRRVITGNGKDYLETSYESSSWVDDGPRKDIVMPGDQVLILGMPREGGFLSMTLKNEYDQITARTIEYGSTQPEELNYSTEKLDPTHYTWVKSALPTFGGTPEKAKNHTFVRAAAVPPHVKNNCYSSIGEIQKVRKAEDWENIGMVRSGKPSTQTLKALAKYFTVAGVKLEAEEAGAHIGGWRASRGTVKQGDAGTCMAEDVEWEPGIWSGQKLRMMTGSQKGETYIIADNTPQSVMIEGYSSPGVKQLSVRPGDTFSVGPGYSSALYYTRKNGDTGEWEWKNKGLKRSSYGLYLAGLSDSINTTEFLEENHNAELSVEAYNYETHAFEPVPQPDEGGIQQSVGLRDTYRAQTQTGRHQYDKSDTVFCGMIYARHISPEGGVRLRLTAHNLNSADCSGFAWLDYAYLAPGETFGKININTASRRVLQALQGVSKELAENICLGRNADGRPSLRPYKNIGDVLDVKGMTPDIFTKICNLITTRSDQYRVQVVAETLDDTDADGTFNGVAGDKILARSEINTLVDRSGLKDGDPGHNGFTVQYIQ